MEQEEHEVYGADIPDEEVEMEADMDTEQQGDEELHPNHTTKELEDMKKRLKEIEEEASSLREMQAKVEKEMGAVQDPAGSSVSQAKKEKVDARSIYVGNRRARKKMKQPTQFLQFNILLRCIMMPNKPFLMCTRIDLLNDHWGETGCKN